MSDYFDYLMKEVERREAAMHKPLPPEVGAAAVRALMKQIPSETELMKRAIDRHVEKIEQSRIPAPKPESFGEWA